MLIYWTLFIAFVSIAAATMHRKDGVRDKIGLSLSFFLLLLLVGLRDQTGNDWYPYLDYYDSIGTNFEVVNHFEYGYKIFSKAFSYVGFGYPVFIFISTLIYLSIYFYVFAKNKYSNILVLLFYSSYLLGLMGTSRQVLALALCLLAAQFLLDGKRRIFYVLVFVATLFHKSAIIFVFASFFVRINLSLAGFFSMLCIAIFVNFILSYFYLFINSISIYSEILSQQLSAYINLPDSHPIYSLENIYLKILLYLKRILFALFFIFSKNLIKEYRSQYNFFLNGYIFSFFIFLSLYSLYPAIAIRASLYFYIFDIFLLNLILLNSKGKLKVFFFILIVLISVQRLWLLLEIDNDFLLPYKAIYMNESFTKDILR
jgi:hypothetical protein